MIYGQRMGRMAQPPRKDRIVEQLPEVGQHVVLLPEVARLVGWKALSAALCNEPGGAWCV